MTPSVALQLLRGMPRAGDHAQRLTQFYGPQAAAYDGTRDRLLPGRREFMQALAVRLPEQALVVDLGGGTAAHWEYVPLDFIRLRALHVVDLCRPLLDLAQQRGQRLGWDYLHVHEADAVAYQPPTMADAVVLSYSLTMIPDWRAAIMNALTWLRPGGLLAVVDFTVGDPVGQPAWQAACWRRWFAHDGVHLDAEHVPFLQRQMPEIWQRQGRHRLPWMPFRIPWYGWLGCRDLQGGRRS